MEEEDVPESKSDVPGSTADSRKRDLIIPFSARLPLGASAVRVTRSALAQIGRSREVRLRIT